MSLITPTTKYPGNARILPQTKFCSLCSAKFTRTTHLNRHIRSHTNQRKFECDTCESKFTRSDLLARHKRSCGVPNASGSRRKSCQECARSKIKCDLQEPCTKCAERGRQCIYVNDPLVSLAKVQSRRPSVTDTAAPSFQSLPGAVESTHLPTPPATQASISAMSHTDSDGSSLSSHSGAEGYSCDTYDNTFAWSPEGAFTPLSSPSYGPDHPPSTPLSTLSASNSSHQNLFNTELNTYMHSLPTNGAVLSPEDLNALLNCPFAGPCYHAPGSCLCHPPLSAEQVQAMMSMNVDATMQYNAGSLPTQHQASQEYTYGPSVSSGAYAMASNSQLHDSMAYPLSHESYYPSHPQQPPTLQYSAQYSTQYPTHYDSHASGTYGPIQ